jgi:hypothetical protein
MDFSLRSCSAAAWLFLLMVCVMLGNGVVGIVYAIKYRDFSYSYGVMPTLGDWLFMIAMVQIIFGIFGLMTSVAGISPNLVYDLFSRTNLRFNYQPLEKSLVYNTASYTLLTMMTIFNVSLGSIGAVNLWSFCKDCIDIVYELWMVALINILSCGLLTLIFIGLTISITLIRPTREIPLLN